MLKFMICALVVVALSGCTEAVPREAEVVTIQASEVPLDGNQQKLANCDSDGTLEYEIKNSEGGLVHIQIRDGKNVLIAGEQLGPNEAGSVDLAGSAGKWNLRVDRDLTFDGDFLVTLTC